MEEELEHIGVVKDDCNGFPWKRIGYVCETDLAVLPIGAKVYGPNVVESLRTQIAELTRTNLEQAEQLNCIIKECEAASTQTTRIVRIKARATANPEAALELIEKHKALEAENERLITEHKEACDALCKQSHEVAELKRQLAERTEWNNQIGRTNYELRKELACTLVAIEAKDATLEKIACVGNGDSHGNSVGNCMAIEALAIHPSTERLEARDRKRDAKLIHQINGSIYSLDTNNRLFDLAKRRESGEWVPDLK